MKVLLIQVQGLLSTLGILDIVDILLVAYFLYTLYQMLINTRAATLVKRFADFVSHYDDK